MYKKIVATAMVGMLVVLVLLMQVAYSRGRITTEAEMMAQIVRKDQVKV